MQWINTATKAYPADIAHLRAAYPHAVFPTAFAGDYEDYAWVQPAEPPAYDPLTHELQEGAPQKQNGTWSQQWDVKALTPEAIEATRRARVPTSCTRRQGRLALLAHGHLDDVEALIAAIADPAERRAAQIEYEADTWERGNPTVQALWDKLGGTPEQLDDLFVMAVTL